MRSTIFALVFATALFTNSVFGQNEHDIGQQSGLPAKPFTYQGRLTTSGTYANGTYDFLIRVYRETEGGEILGENTVEGVNVSFGVFTVPLNFDADVFQGAETAFLDIWVRQSGESDFTQLSPRQQIGSTPFARVAESSKAADTINCSNCITDAHVISIAGDKIVGTVAHAANALTAQNAVNAVDLTSNQTVGGNKTFTGTISGDGSGLSNVPGTFKWQTVTSNTKALPNNGYLANGHSQTVITLPASPNVGDTIRVTGLGAGGWRISQNAGQFVLGSNLGISVFTPVESDRGWGEIVSSDDGTKLAAAVRFPRDHIYTSSDSGQTWTPRETVREWRTIASSADGTKLAAAEAGGRIYTSADSGETWTARESNRSWSSIASSADGTIIAATAGLVSILISRNSGATWTTHGSGQQWSGIAMSDNGSKMVAVASQGRIYTSADSGLNWIERETVRQWRGVTSSADGSKLAAFVLNGQIYTSTDSGVTWTPRETNRQWESITSSADGTKLAAVVAGGQIFISTDSGLNWTEYESNRQWRSIASSADGSKLAATVNGGQIFITTSTTTLGAAGYLTGGQNSAIELQYIGDGKFIPISFVGAVRGY